MRAEQTQAVLDALQQVLGAAADSRITVQALKTVLPRLKESEPDTESEERQGSGATREALYESVEKNARLDRNFVLLVVLSTIVAAIGLVKNNAAVVIGAMLPHDLSSHELMTRTDVGLESVALASGAALVGIIYLKG